MFGQVSGDGVLDIKTREQALTARLARFEAKEQQRMLDLEYLQEGEDVLASRRAKFMEEKMMFAKEREELGRITEAVRRREEAAARKVREAEELAALKTREAEVRTSVAREMAASHVKKAEEAAEIRVKAAEEAAEMKVKPARDEAMEKQAKAEEAVRNAQARVMALDGRENELETKTKALQDERQVLEHDLKEYTPRLGDLEARVKAQDKKEEDFRKFLQEKKDQAIAQKHSLLKRENEAKEAKAAAERLLEEVKLRQQEFKDEEQSFEEKKERRAKEIAEHEENLDKWRAEEADRTSLQARLHDQQALLHDQQVKLGKDQNKVISDRAALEKDRLALEERENHIARGDEIHAERAKRLDNREEFLEKLRDSIDYDAVRTMEAREAELRNSYAELEDREAAVERGSKQNDDWAIRIRKWADAKERHFAQREAALNERER